MVASLRPSWTSNTSPLPGSNPAHSDSISSYMAKTEVQGDQLRTCCYVSRAA